MKMNKIQFTAAVCLLAIACNKEIPANPGQEGKLVEKTFTATYAMSDDSDSKVAIDNIDGVKANLKWEENDAIKVFAINQDGNEATATNISVNTADFNVSVPVSQDNFYYAVYPASAVDNKWGTNDQNNYLKVTIPHEQTAVHDSFDPNAYIATAKAESNNNSLIFQPVVSAFCFHFEKENEPGKIKSIKFETGVSSALAIAGTFVCYSNTFQSASWLGGTSVKQTSVTLNAPTDGFKKGATYYVVVRPSEYKDGITFTFNYKDGTTKTATYTNSINIAKGKIKNLGDLSARMKPGKSLYEAYVDGHEVKIGDITLQSTGNNPVAAKAITGSDNAQNPTDITNEIAVGKVNFISGYCKIASTKYLSSSTYLVANSDNAVIEIATDKGYIAHREGNLGIKGITINKTGSKGYIITNDSSTTPGKLIFDGCKITTDKSVYYVSSNPAPNSIYVVDTDVELTANAHVFNLSNMSDTVTPSINIENSLFYSDSGLNNSRVILVKDANSVTFENNTIYKINPGTKNGVIHANNSVNNVTVSNCLFSFGTLAGDAFIYNQNQAINPVNCYYNWSGNYKVLPYDGYQGSDLSNTSGICGTEYPYASNYPGCGAQR